MNTNKDTKTRFVKIVKSTYSKLDEHEGLINNTILELRAKGGKIINIQQDVFGMNPMYMVCTIIYQAENPISTQLPSTKKKGGSPKKEGAANDGE